MLQVSSKRLLSRSSVVLLMRQTIVSALLLIAVLSITQGNTRSYLLPLAVFLSITYVAWEQYRCQRGRQLDARITALRAAENSANPTVKTTDTTTGRAAFHGVVAGVATTAIGHTAFHGVAAAGGTFDIFAADRATEEPLNFRNASLSRFKLKGAYLEKADFSNANLSNSNLSGANLKNADLRKANLINANLKDADLSNANLAGAHLIGANLSGAVIRNADLKKASLGGADLSNADLEYADFENAHLRASNLRNARLKGANFSTATLVESELDSAELEMANFEGSNVERARFCNNLGLSGLDKKELQERGAIFRDTPGSNVPVLMRR